MTLGTWTPGSRTLRLIFALCLILIFFALGWTSATMLQLEKSEHATRQYYSHQDDIQTALHNAAATLHRILSGADSQPYFYYTPAHYPSRPYNDQLTPPLPGERLRPSPFLATPNPLARLHFTVTPQGIISSPEAPPPEWTLPAASPKAADALRQLLEKHQGIDFHAAYLLAEPLGTTAIHTPSLTPADPAAPLRFTGNLTRFRPTWLDNELYLLRRASTTHGDILQGIWLNWEHLHDTLQAHLAPHLPNATLHPATAHSADGHIPLPPFPLHLIPPPPPPVSPTPNPLVLIAVWMFAALAMAGLSALFFGAVSLSERRATFVSAVTHELRTPLTTFQLYTEMLTSQMVPPDAVPHYHATLHAEATRLTHLVENVLGFARLERGRALRRDEILTTGQLLARTTQRLEKHLAAHHITFTHQATPGTLPLALRTDSTAVEQILFNLADNTAKYATPGNPNPAARLHVCADATTLHFEFSDNGPGIPLSARKKLFKPFNRSAEEAAGKKPGVGLGLAFSRQLARRLGGDLTHRPTPTGCTLRLHLPRHTPRITNPDGAGAATTPPPHPPRDNESPAPK
ncbi:MAG: HAMP domain-containing histidine kinase [Puniceicoccales bacterium]|jgi:signal transduction histidine kinase|nr:HAMP domain-containing histidine kinase [Puniceicoccales bacterium]